MKYLQKKFLSGFTVLEVVIAIGILFLILGSSVLFLGSSPQVDLALKDESFRIENTLRTARYKALIGEETDWGVYFSNLSQFRPFYAVFKGSSWNENLAENKKILDSNLFFNVPTSGTTSLVVFERLTGNLKNASSVIIEIRAKKSPLFGKRIYVNQIGGIEVQDISP